MTPAVRDALAAGCAEVGIELSEAQLETLGHFLALLQKWNARINLTGTRDDEEIVWRHLVDSLAVARHVPAEAGRVVDVGSGAGLPAIVIAIARPDVSVMSLEPIRKKHAFQSAARRELPLENLQPIAERVEAHGARVGRGYDVAVSRATWPVDEWLPIGESLVRPGGLVLGMEGADERPLPAGATRHRYRLQSRARAVVRLVAG